MNEKLAAEKQIREAMARFLGELASASPAQWQFRPSPTQWSMADVAEHVASPIATSTRGSRSASSRARSRVGRSA